MKIALVVGLLTLSLGGATAGAQARTTQNQPALKVCTLKVAGMTCAGCEAAVKIAAKSVNGVRDVKASYDKANADVTYDPSKTTPEAIAKVITSKTGFKAEVPRANK
ncbi:MAG TPA: cation transporter [Vicinamibacterales bacterium]|nr:cation transporter [Vicinamibacterales bacterium]